MTVMTMMLAMLMVEKRDENEIRQATPNSPACLPRSQDIKLENMFIEMNELAFVSSSTHSLRFGMQVTLHVSQIHLHFPPRTQTHINHCCDNYGDRDRYSSTFSLLQMPPPACTTFSPSQNPLPHSFCGNFRIYAIMHASFYKFRIFTAGHIRKTPAHKCISSTRYIISSWRQYYVHSHSHTRTHMHYISMYHPRCLKCTRFVLSFVPRVNHKSNCHVYTYQRS